MIVVQKILAMKSNETNKNIALQNKTTTAHKNEAFTLYNVVFLYDKAEIRDIKFTFYKYRNHLANRYCKSLLRFFFIF